jgi:hypothetical protein
MRGDLSAFCCIHLYKYCASYLARTLYALLLEHSLYQIAGPVSTSPNDHDTFAELIEAQQTFKHYNGAHTGALSKC